MWTHPTHPLCILRSDSLDHIWSCSETHTAKFFLAAYTWMLPGPLKGPPTSVSNHETCSLKFVNAVCTADFTNIQTLLIIAQFLKLLSEEKLDKWQIPLWQILNHSCSHESLSLNNKHWVVSLPVKIISLLLHRPFGYITPAEVWICKTTHVFTAVLSSVIQGWC